MKKLLLLLLVVVGIVGCGDKWQDVEPKPEVKGNILLDTERAIKEAKEYGINTSEIEINMSIRTRNYNADSTIIFTGRLNERLWISVHDCVTKHKINNSASTEKYELEIKTFEPYIGEIIDSIKYFYVTNFIYKGNDCIFVLDVVLQNKIDPSIRTYYNTLLFSENNIIKDDFTRKPLGSISVKQWGGNTILLRDRNNNTTTIGCYSMKGEFIYNVIVESAMSYIPTNNKYDGINIYNNIISRINIQTGDILWNQNINLNIPETAKYELTKSELINANTVKAIYDITLYDGTKTTKIVNIDINTGEYIVL